MTASAQATPDAAMTIGTLRAEPGTMARGSVPADLGTTIVEIPVTLVNGARPGPTVAITAGVHGGEFIGVDAATRLCSLLEPAEVRGRLAICPVANPPTVYQGRIDASPLDGVNLNRVFPGDADGGPTERLAAWIFATLIDGADAYVDLHSGGIDETLRDFVGYRIAGDAEVDAKARGMAHALGYEDVILGLNAEGGNSHAAAARQGVPAILVETGQLGERDLAHARVLVEGLFRLLHHLGVLDRPPSESQAIPVREWVWVGAVAAEVGGLWYPEVGTGDDVTAGQVIGRIIDPADGREHKVGASATGRIFYGMRGLTVAPGAELAAIAAPYGGA
ncbi:hypothetical protein GCM10029978_056540 [Actinoallomurus acanthiterrae]